MRHGGYLPATTRAVAPASTRSAVSQGLLWVLSALFVSLYAVVAFPALMLVAVLDARRCGFPPRR